MDLEREELYATEEVVGAKKKIVFTHQSAFFGGFFWGFFLGNGDLDTMRQKCLHQNLASRAL